MVHEATERARKRVGPRDYTTLTLEGRDICNRWAQRRGYLDFDAAQRDGRAYAEVIASIVDATPGVQGFKTLPRTQ